MGLTKQMVCYHVNPPELIVTRKPKSSKRVQPNVATFDVARVITVRRSTLHLCPLLSGGPPQSSPTGLVRRSRIYFRVTNTRGSCTRRKTTGIAAGWLAGWLYSQFEEGSADAIKGVCREGAEHVLAQVPASTVMAGSCKPADRGQIDLLEDIDQLLHTTLLLNCDAIQRFLGMKIQNTCKASGYRQDPCTWQRARS